MVLREADDNSPARLAKSSGLVQEISQRLGEHRKITEKDSVKRARHLRQIGRVDIKASNIIVRLLDSSQDIEGEMRDLYRSGAREAKLVDELQASEEDEDGRGKGEGASREDGRDMRSFEEVERREMEVEEGFKGGDMERKLEIEVGIRVSRCTGAYRRRGTP